MKPNLKSLHHMEVRHINLWMLCKMGILHSHKNSLFEEVLIDESAVPFWHQHSAIEKE